MATRQTYGNGLTQLLGGPSGGSWVLRYKSPDGRRREIGFGTCLAVSLVDAQAKVAQAHRLLAKGIDPLDQRATERATTPAVAKSDDTTFDAQAAQYIADNTAGWRNPKHAAQWAATLKTYASPVIGSKPCGDISVRDVVTVLRPIWSTKSETASRVRGRIELVLRAAKANGHRAGDNPASRENVSALLPNLSRVRTVRHHPALPAARVQAFWWALLDMPGTGAQALQFAILTAARSGEVRGMIWSEITWSDSVWTIPAGRMKAGRAHRVPLPPAAIELLKAVGTGKRDPAGVVFPGAAGVAPLSDMSVAAVIKRMNAGNSTPWVDINGEPITVHGFRSTFRDWVSEETEFNSEVAEAALAHVVGNKTEAAYRRGDQLAKRRALMVAWANHLLAGGMA